jgi:hypothetical protein
MLLDNLSHMVRIAGVQCFQQMPMLSLGCLNAMGKYIIEIMPSQAIPMVGYLAE